eukprot:XP_001704994.1 Hypothetical protein GL50803_19237 [Giardia lamblia ATCC 50803]
MPVNKFTGSRGCASGELRLLPQIACAMPLYMHAVRVARRFNSDYDVAFSVLATCHRCKKSSHNSLKNKGPRGKDTHDDTNKSVCTVGNDASVVVKHSEKRLLCGSFPIEAHLDQFVDEVGK